MALAPKTVLTYPLDGSNRDFTIPFEYLARKFVQVTLIGRDRKLLTLNIDYRFTQRTIITTTKSWGPADGYERIEIRRYTSATERLVDFSDGSILRAYDLNTSQVQSLHIAEEGRDVASDTIGVNNDGDLDARGRKIVNLADAVSDGDAVTLRQEKAWGNSALNQANRAEQQANGAAYHAGQSAESARLAGIHNYEAKDAATRADASRQASENAQINSQSARDKAQQWAEAPPGTQVEPGHYSSMAWARTAGDYAAQAADSRDRANNSAVASYQDAERSKREADRAKTEADKLGNWNSLGAAVDAVDGDSVWWKGRAMFRDSVWCLADGDANFYFSNKNGVGRVLRMVRDSAENWLLVDDARGRIRLHSDTSGSLNVFNDVNASGNLRSKGGAVYAMANSAGGNSHMWLQDQNGVENGLVWAGGDKTLHIRAGEGQPISVRKSGSLVTSAGIELGTASLQSDGNISSPIYTGGTLHQYLSRLNAAVAKAQYSHSLLWQGSWSSGTTIVLNEDALNFHRFTSQWNNGTRCILTGLTELAHYSFGEIMYMGAGNGIWYRVKFNDLGDGTYRSLTMVDAGVGAVALPHIYGYRKTV